MRQVETTHEWAEANQAYLVAEFARLTQQLGSSRVEEPLESALREVVEAKATLKKPSAIDQLTELFGLSNFERDLLLLCAGVEMDSKLMARCAEVHGHPQRTCVTFGLAMASLSDPHWSALTPSRPLRRFRLLEKLDGQGLTSAPLHIDERILHYLAGVNLLDLRLEPFLRRSVYPTWIAEEHKDPAAELVRILEGSSEEAHLVHLCGDDLHGQEDVAALAATASGQQLFALRAEDTPAVGPDLDQFIALWKREAALLPAILLLQSGSESLTPAARQLVERLPSWLIVASRESLRMERAFIRFEINKPQPSGQKRLWQQALGPAAENFNGSLDRLSDQFRLSARSIFFTGMLTTSGEVPPQPKDLWEVCRSMSRPRLEDLAARIVPRANWDDLVLPDAQKEILFQVASQVRHRMRVYETWGFSARGRRGLGVTALFAGESGTGKTLAAEVLAHELALDLYRIDLSAVVSKYIGETEKNLRRIFDAAEEGGVLLLFDEADALFGKRSDVKDSRDRYANIEVSYLLQRMEEYQGLAILTTNLKGSIDRAFQRRLRFTVNFPFPDAHQREAIWHKIFPAATPTNGLDLKRLAQLNMPGGNIRNIALNAAFLAVETASPVEMRHLLQAARMEAHKVDRPLSEAEIQGWA